MKLLVFTSNSLRHNALLNMLEYEGHQIVAYIEYRQEVTTNPNQLGVLDRYFQKVKHAEKEIFGKHEGLADTIITRYLPFGAINNISVNEVERDLYDSDAVIIFGSSYIKDPIITKLTDQKAINIHMGISPYYRGVGCNFWALFDGNHHLVGATLHYLDRGLDSGNIIDYAFPRYVEGTDLFYFTMSAVREAHKCVLNLLSKSNFLEFPGIVQDPEKLLRYSRSRDFTENEAKRYFERESDILMHVQNSLEIDKNS